MSPNSEDVRKQYCSIGRFTVELTKSRDDAMFNVSFSCKGEKLAYYQYADASDAAHDYHLICDTMSVMIETFRNDPQSSEVPPSHPYGMDADSGIFRIASNRKQA